MDFIENWKIAKEANHELLIKFGIDQQFIPPVINNELYEAYAIEELMKKKSKQLLEMKLNNNELTNSQPFLQKLHNEIKNRKEKLKPFYFITISPKEDIDYEDFFDAIESTCNWIFMEEGMYAYEQRGIDEIKGIHCHIILMKYNVKPKTLIKRLTDKFKKFCEPKNGSYENVINVKQKKAEFLQDKIDYITGKKNDEDKPEKIWRDKIMREKYNLKEYYTFDLLTDKEVKGKRGGAREGAGRKNKKKIDMEVENKIVKIEF